MKDPTENPQVIDLAARMKAAVTEAGGHKAVAMKSGIPGRTLSDLLTGRDPKTSHLIALADACGVTVEWLATGRPPRRRPEASESGAAQLERVQSFSHGPHLKAPHRDEMSNYSLIPAFNINRSGHLAYKSPQIVEYFAFDTAWLKGSLRVSPENLVLIEVNDDDMLPAFSSGDAVLVDVSWREVRVGGVYALGEDDRIVLRRVRRRPDGKAVISADGGRVPPREIDLQETFTPIFPDEKTLFFGVVVWKSSLVRGF